MTLAEFREATKELDPEMEIMGYIQFDGGYDEVEFCELEVRVPVFWMRSGKKAIFLNDTKNGETQ